MTSPMRIIVLGLLLLFISGCQHVGVHSSQLNAVISAFYLDSAALPDSGWVVQFGGYNEAVRPVTAKTSTVFVNDIDAITFNGWTITQVRGLNSFTPAWDIKDSGSERSFLVKGQIVATHQCGAWLKGATDVGVRFEQQCKGASEYTNTILVDSLGQITSIEQVVDSSLMVLQLRLDNY